MNYIRPFLTVQNLPITAQLLTFVVIAVYVFISWRTLRAIKRQIDLLERQTEASEGAAIAAQQSATAATKSVEAYMLAERPWICVNHNARRGYEAAITFTAENWGRTPAEILSWTVQVDFLASLNDLPKEPRYGTTGARTNHEWLLPENEIEIYSYHLQQALKVENQELWNQIQMSKRILVFIGFVQYRDAMTRRAHETRFCYWLNPAPGVGLQMTGPTTEYNRMT